MEYLEYFFEYRDHSFDTLDILTFNCDLDTFSFSFTLFIQFSFWTNLDIYLSITKFYNVSLFPRHWVELLAILVSLAFEKIFCNHKCVFISQWRFIEIKFVDWLFLNLFIQIKTLVTFEIVAKNML